MTARELATLTVAALAHVEAHPCLPPASVVRIYFRMGRRFTRVFWAYQGADVGSILVYVENATGRVYSAKTSTKAGTATDAVWA